MCGEEEQAAEAFEAHGRVHVRTDEDDGYVGYRVGGDVVIDWQHGDPLDRAARRMGRLTGITLRWRDGSGASHEGEVDGYWYALDRLRPREWVEWADKHAREVAEAEASRERLRTQREAAQAKAQAVVQEYREAAERDAQAAAAAKAKALVQAAEIAKAHAPWRKLQRDAEAEARRDRAEVGRWHILQMRREGLLAAEFDQEDVELAALILSARGEQMMPGSRVATRDGTDRGTLVALYSEPAGKATVRWDGGDDTRTTVDLAGLMLADDPQVRPGDDVVILLTGQWGRVWSVNDDEPLSPTRVEVQQSGETLVVPAACLAPLVPASVARTDWWPKLGEVVRYRGMYRVAKGFTPGTDGKVLVRVAGWAYPVPRLDLLPGRRPLPEGTVFFRSRADGPGDEMAVVLQGGVIVAREEAPQREEPQEWAEPEADGPVPPEVPDEVHEVPTDRQWADGEWTPAGLPGMMRWSARDATYAVGDSVPGPLRVDGDGTVLATDNRGDPLNTWCAPGSPWSYSVGMVVFVPGEAFDKEPERIVSIQPGGLDGPIAGLRPVGVPVGRPAVVRDVLLARTAPIQMRVPVEWDEPPVPLVDLGEPEGPG